MRSGFAMSDCDADTSTLRWARRYTHDPAAFSASLKRAMPLLLYVLNQVEALDVPTEFALLPYVESTYNPAASNNGRALGMWQLMPATARSRGLRMARHFDQRMDPVASTRVALNLLIRHHRSFHDWRLADLAFNAGSYRIRRALDNRTVRNSPAPTSDLGLNTTTRDHLAKLQALACIVSQPSRFGVNLPAANENDVLVVVELQSPVDLLLASRLSGVDYDRIRFFNPEYEDARMSAKGPFRVLLPAAARDPLVSNLAPLPESIRTRWHELRLQHTENLSVLAYANDIKPAYLAAANRVPVDAKLRVGTRVLLPDHSTHPFRRHVNTVSAKSTSPQPERYIVRRGDTLWAIARRSRIRMDNLRRWNGLDKHATLRLGQRLRLSTPDRNSTPESSDVVSN